VIQYRYHTQTSFQFKSSFFLDPGEPSFVLVDIPTITTVTADYWGVASLYLYIRTRTCLWFQTRFQVPCLVVVLLCSVLLLPDSFSAVPYSVLFCTSRSCPIVLSSVVQSSPVIRCRPVLLYSPVLLLPLMSSSVV
jgi:hypothetical protein